MSYPGAVRDFAASSLSRKEGKIESIEHAGDMGRRMVMGLYEAKSDWHAQYVAVQGRNDGQWLMGKSQQILRNRGS